jgi:hypothetical protein
MAAQAQPAKVLRIGIIQDGKIVQERLIKAGEKVSVGEAASNTFVFPKTSLQSKSFDLFEVNGDSYTLAFTEQMGGKISSGGAVVGLEKLRADPSVARDGAQWRLPLTHQDRGKISVDNLTVLFQFVPPPPTQAVKPIQEMDFRPRLMDEEDPVFLGFLGVFGALAAVFLVWVWNAPPPRELKLEDIPDRFTRLVIEPVEPIETPKVENIDPNQQGPNEKKSEPDPNQKASKKAESSNPDVARAQRARAAQSEAVEGSLLLKMLVTRGESGRGTAADLWGNGDAAMGDLDAALAQVGGVGVATASEQGMRAGLGTGTGDVDIGDLAGVKGGKSEVGGGPEITVQGETRLGEGTIDEDVGDQEAVRRTVERNFGQLTYCYEQQLRASPTLSGRVEVEWYIRERRVTSATVFANTTGNSALGECILEKIRRWRFDEGLEGEILYPFVFTPKG